ncbi:hypothetical protein HPB50_010337 [Hyalomma asiaticum]|uniref:Uncharacterized protein n=1 Tax=Hyalomma asiaticum TaxID=266040 RepID=A0ACB7ST26_HYAAI|nr:hypothetical protein HPB50_010337 [Hyalomma asiaticum]
MCHVMKNLPVVNAMLSRLNVEVDEVTPGRLFLCQADPIGSRIRDCEGIPAEESIVFLYSLLQKHRCIEAFKPHLRKEPALLITNALLYNNCLTCLRVHHASLSDQATLSLFVALCQLLKKQLRELSLEKLDITCLPETLDEFREALARTQSLTTLTLLNIRVSSKPKEHTHASMSALNVALTGLQANKSVTILKMDTSYQYDGSKILKDFLVSTVTLTELHIYCSYDCSSRPCLDSIFEVLADNVTVKRLTLRKFAVKDMTSFKQLLGVNKTLEDVTFYASLHTGTELQSPLKTPTTDQVPEQHVRTVIEILKKGTNLRRLSLDWNCTSSTVRSLLEASEGSHSLKELHLGNVIIDNPYVLHWTFVTKKTDLSVTASRCAYTNGSLSELVQCWKSGDKETYVHCLYNVNLGDLSRALSSAPGDHVTSLSVVVGKFSSRSTVHALAAYLATTLNLRELQLRLDAMPQYFYLVLCSGFQRNIRRNRKLLRFAAAFACGTLERRAARAFNIANQHPQLTEAVQHIGRCSQDKAKQLISEAPLQLNRNFWWLTGIVKDKITCATPSTSKQVQLADCSVRILDHIASFLKVGDIVNYDELANGKSEWPYLEDPAWGHPKPSRLFL